MASEHTMNMIHVRAHAQTPPQTERIRPPLARPTAPGIRRPYPRPIRQTHHASAFDGPKGSVSATAKDLSANNKADKGRKEPAMAARTTAACRITCRA